MGRNPRFHLPADEAAYRAHLAAASARRRRSSKHCAECGATFVGITKAVYCSPRCRAKAHYYAGKERARHPTPPLPPADA